LVGYAALALLTVYKNENIPNLYSNKVNLAYLFVSVLVHILCVVYLRRISRIYPKYTYIVYEEIWFATIIS